MPAALPLAILSVMLPCAGLPAFHRSQLTHNRIRQTALLPPAKKNVTLAGKKKFIFCRKQMNNSYSGDNIDI
ncbi:hypothetical protein BL250_10610 [Erwinia sp. OLTSP20]|uniref:hypothetical protein n=1 Tax=unclassified Erwinia TaxID=2622719 RepID=UPI000C198B30|nr:MULTISPECIES: hypothetical protein [unclassified Erwinia]PIJ50132.1 hypothetical protein BV501_09835 [Erwinia sp. OAMSP11]PIJ71898.1 hypothetical protein BK416_10920 [Erwinia sp. OLSSP12]PIJ81100.1 hypothetical protein BLD47_09780 [Erwinia sp. OLCASP19]PIJ83530.1 hypothetical protein BLD46_09570 [Erwinia sp. OLMTSP26]PIJ86145.1 hypothetical protein BLD49_08895 [Erwinia sp. OLMDSP33]